MNKVNDMQKVPKLRFLEFSGEWKNISLGGASDKPMYGMNCASKFYDGKNKYLRITDIDPELGVFSMSHITSPDGDLEEKYKLTSGDLLFVRTGASVGKTYLYQEADGVVYFAGFIIKFSIIDANSRFVYYQTLRTHYNNWVTSISMRSGQPGINAEEYKLFLFYCPLKNEQEKIADFLTVVDDKIQQLTKKKSLLEQYKKGLMQQIFSQKIRFKDDNGNDYPDWEEKKLGEVVDNFGGTSLEKYASLCGKYKFISIGNYSKDGYYIDNYQRIEANEKSLSKLLNKDNLVMVLNDKTSKGDIIGATILIDQDNTYIYNQRSERLVCKKSISPKFMWHVMNCSIFRAKIFEISQGGTQIYVNFPSVKNLDLNIPILLEQTKIANFLTSIDDKITLTNKELDQTKLYKKSLLQQMFI